MSDFFDPCRSPKILYSGCELYFAISTLFWLSCFSPKNPIWKIDPAVWFRWSYSDCWAVPVPC